MIKIYFKLVDKIEQNLTLSDWKKFKSLFQSEITAILEKLKKINKINETCEIQIRFFDTMSNGFDLDQFASENNKKDDWDISKFFRESGLVFNINLKLNNIMSLVKKDVSGKIIYLRKK
jgi:hypothetical protein